MTFVQKKATAFLVGEEGFDLKTFFVPIHGFVGEFKIRDQKERVTVAALPMGNHRHRAIALSGEPNIWNANLIPAAQAQITEREGQPVFVELDILSRATGITQIQSLQGSLQVDAIKFPIAQENRLAVGGQKRFELGK